MEPFPLHAELIETCLGAGELCQPRQRSRGSWGWWMSEGTWSYLSGRGL